MAAVLIAVRQVDPISRLLLPTPIPIDFGETGGDASLPQILTIAKKKDIARVTIFQTEKSDNRSFEVIIYTVEFLDSLFGIAADHNIEPETLLWANEGILGGNADMLEPGMVLNLPPVDGVLYKWKEGDTLEEVIYIPPEDTCPGP